MLTIKKILIYLLGIIIIIISCFELGKINIGFFEWRELFKAIFLLFCIDRGSVVLEYSRTKERNNGKQV